MTGDRREQLHSLSIDRDAGAVSSGASLVQVLMIALVSLAVGAGGMWWLTRGDDDAAQPEPVAVQTETPPPAAQSAADTTPAPSVPRSTGMVASGYVVARRQATVSAEITGRIREVLVEEGTRVEAGDILARLDDERARLDLDLLQARVRSARSRIASLTAQLEEAMVVSERAQSLAERNIGSQAAVTAAEAQRDSLIAQLSAARADLSAAEVQVASQEDLIRRHEVRAPFAGVVIAKNAQVGEILSPASAGGGFTRTGVATLVDMDSLEIEVDVNEGQIGRVEPGQRVEAVLDAYPDWRIPARVEAIIPTADRARATIQVRVAFEERDGRILPDMAARVTFVE
ncbi:efflux RND transporter periplasmic adaptor subunit [Hyphobacterium marinum]|uniref:Efflux RND transporter periplasmic adaptor subunit n=1 Tax=Hyphobacterium marinum TaxID=3116574 RepID=A0ABU7LXK6_9PROT|nr:efflux RND transporter periplasmic adaptor subunit [Hyphobacterium sp. Y6023]MEE2566278.1 efflux RND transporter periplasmic adaptor subunit [Hyphobacterium sp. Y6023]